MTDIVVSKEKLEEEIKQTISLAQTVSVLTKSALTAGTLADANDNIVKLAELSGRRLALQEVLRDKYRVD